MHSSLLTWHNSRLKQLKDMSHNAQSRRSGEISSPIFVTYKNDVRPHGCHIYSNAADMEMSTMCTFTSKNHGLPHWKYMLRCCDKGSIIVLPSREANKDTTNTFTTIIFHV